MKPKGPQRYRHANDIRDAIDRYRAKAAKLRASAAALDFQAAEFAKAGNPTDSEFKREQAEKKRASASRIEERQLTKLKHKLSELMTPQLPAVDNGDPSIPVA